MSEDNGDERREGGLGTMPWFLSIPFTAVTMAVCLVVWIVSLSLLSRPLWGAHASGDLSFSMGLQLSALGAVLGVLSGISRSQAMGLAVSLRMDAELEERIGQRAEDRYIWAAVATPPGHRAMIAELLGIVAGTALGIAARSLTPVVLVFSSLSACEQAIYLRWLRRQAKRGQERE
jgi:hypothetical protein